VVTLLLLMVIGALSVSVADTCYITCAKTKIKVILEYLEEGWLGRTQNKVQGAIFNFDPENDIFTKIKDVPDKDVLGRIEGNWQDKVYYTLGNQPFAKAKVCLGCSFYDNTRNCVLTLA
jgi:oxysterol-binding protein-related protein 9/10/11